MNSKLAIVTNELTTIIDSQDYNRPQCVLKSVVWIIKAPFGPSTHLCSIWSFYSEIWKALKINTFCNVKTRDMTQRKMCI